MGDETKISWCDHTFNIFWGCSKVSPGCNSCYAESFDHRLGGKHWGPTAPRRFFGDAYWRKPVAWNAAAQKAGVRSSVFCSSMADWAEIHEVLEVRERQDEARDRLWRLISATPWLEWLMLTKRPENFSGLLPWARGRRHWAPSNVGCGHCCGVEDGHEPGCPTREPYPNVTLMVTGENTEQLLRRSAILRSMPAVRRAISAEPLLEHIPASAWDEALPGIDRLIVGDESGHGRRLAQLDWVRTARDAAERHGVAFHLKQLHVNGKVVHLPVLDGRTHSD
jgi:protein gp37